MHLELPPVPQNQLFTDTDRFRRAMALVPRLGKLADAYRPWRKVKAIARDMGFDPADAWTALKVLRFSGHRSLSLLQIDGSPFTINLGNHLLEPLHRIDRATGGGGAAATESSEGLLADETHRTRLAVRSLMDEAIESSLIEGAATTRKIAIEMLRENRAPKSKGERMVANNYVAMQWIKQRLDVPLSEKMLLELQGMLTEGTLDESSQSRRYRRSDEDIRVVDDRESKDIFVPPPAEQVSARVAALCEFANQEHRGSQFIHPLVKASILHFMLGYIHPFVDGNGRTARAVFFWHALRSGYRIFEYMPISDRIRAGYAKYPQAYLDSELDGGDLTYFVMYSLEIIEQSLDRLAEHLRREEARIQSAAKLLRISTNLNLRQRLLLEHALRHPLTQYTVKSHKNSNGITPVTARADLEGLVKLRLMTTLKRGKEVIYMASPKLAERVDRKGR